jgi:hypothetical protein
MPFEVFQEQRSRAKEPSVTVQKRGTIAMNRAAADLIGRPAAVELLYDAELAVIGLRAVDASAAHAYTVRPTGTRKQVSEGHPGGFVVSGVAFLKHHRIDIRQATRYHVYVDGDVLCLDLRQTGTPVTSNREGR